MPIAYYTGRCDIIRSIARAISMQHLEVLVHVVKEGTFSGAARKLLLTQPSVTKHIKNLEDILGASIVNRGSKLPSLTREGEIVYSYAKRILRLRDEAVDKVISTRNEAKGNIFIGASTIPSTYILPKVIGSFRDSYPDISLHIKGGDTGEVLDMVMNSQVELGFVGKETRNKKIYCEPLWEDNLVLVVPRKHRMANKKQVGLKDIAGEPYINREKGSGTRMALDEYLMEHTGKDTSQFNIVCEMGGSEAVKEAILEGLGISILSIYAVKRELELGELKQVAIKDHSIRRIFYLVYRRQFRPERYQKVFIDFVKENRHRFQLKGI